MVVITVMYKIYMNYIPIYSLIFYELILLIFICYINTTKLYWFKVQAKKYIQI